MLRAIGILAADVVLGCLAAGVALPMLIAAGFVREQWHAAIVVAACIVLVGAVHAKTRGRSRR